MISAILITENNVETIDKTLYSLVLQKGLTSYQVLVFDKGSKDGTVTRINTFKCKYPSIIKNITNKSIPEKDVLNYCITKSNSDRVIIIDPNTQLIDLEAINIQNKYLNTHKNINGVYTKYVNMNEKDSNYGVCDNIIKCSSTLLIDHKYASNNIIPDNVNSLNLNTVEIIANHQCVKEDVIKQCNNPKVSVIIPVYNTSKYLHQCMNSVINQTLKEIEIICVDDGSIDDSLAILSLYAKKDKRINIISQQHSLAGAARNRGMELAKGEYLYFLDSDDWIELDTLSTNYRIAKQYDSDIVSFGGDKYDGSINKIVSFDGLTATTPNEIIIKKPDEIKGELFSIFSPSCWCKLFKRSFVQSYNIHYQQLENANDVGFVYTACCLAKTIACYNKPFIHYRYNIPGQTSDKLVQFSPKNIYDAFCFVKDNVEKNNKHYLLDDKFYKRYINSLKYQKRKSPKTFDAFRNIYISFLPKDYRGLYDVIFGPENDEVIPVVMATNDNYVQCLSVTIKSIKKYKNMNTTINIYVFYTSLSESNKDIILKQEDEKTTITLINVSPYLKKAKLYTRCWYSVEMYYRALIPNILSNYKKAIYLDCDTILQDDIEKLYRYNIDNYCLGVIKDYLPIKIREYVSKRLKLNPEDYFNSGVLLFNINKCKGDDLQEKFFRFVSNHRKLLYPDQDTLNVICKGSVRFLPIKWNIMWQHYINPRDLTGEYKDMLDEALSDPGIIHYSSKIKPWNNKDLFLSNRWWEINNTDNNIETNSNCEEFKLKINKEMYNDCENPKFSLIIPVYNEEKHIKECIDSILMQTYTNFELICVDDGSIDSSFKILNEYAKKYKRITLIKQNNSKQGKARNKALEIARGEYIWFVDSDDKITEDALDIINRNIEMYNSDLICFEACNFYKDGHSEQSDGQKIKNVLEKSGSYLTIDSNLIKRSIPISACLFAVKKKVLDQFNIRFSEYCFFEDNIFLIKCLHYINKISYEKCVLYNRRKHENSTTANWEKNFDDYLLAIRDIQDFYESINIDCNNKIDGYCTFALSKYSSFKKEYRDKYKLSLICTLLYLNKYNKFGVKIFGEHPFYEQLKKWWFSKKHKTLNFKKIQTIGECIQWIKLNDVPKIKTKLANKIKVREYISNKIGDKYLVPLLGVYGSFDEIDFKKFNNNPIVLKCNHGSGWNHIILDSSNFDYESIKNDFDRWMSRDYAEASYELQYNCIPRRILVEQYIDPTRSPYEIQVYCINNIPSYVSVETIKDVDVHRRCIFDVNGNPLDFMITPEHYQKLDFKTIDTELVKKCVELTKNIVVNTPFARYDFIQVDNDIKFREITFTSGSGLSTYSPEKYDYFYGSQIKLNN